MFAYEFQGYWKGYLGTIDSLGGSTWIFWTPTPHVDLSDENWKIYSRSPVMPPQYVGEEAVIQEFAGN